MRTNTSVVLDDHLAGYVADQVRTGNYASTSDALRAGLRVLEERAAAIEVLRAAIQGLASGATRSCALADEIFHRARVGSHIIVHRKVGNDIEVVRLRHVSMDVALHL